MESSEFYDRLPRNTIELFGGACLIGGSLQVSRMVLASILQGYGASYLQGLLDQSMLEIALIEAHSSQHYVPRPASAFADKVVDLPLARMASELRMNLYMLDQFGVKGRDQVIKIGEDALTPEIFICRDREDERQHEYFCDGAPELIIDFIHPATRSFDEQLRLKRYQQLGAAEIWLVDAQREIVDRYSRRAEAYQHSTITANQSVNSDALPGLVLHAEKLLTIKENPWKNYRGLVSYQQSGQEPKALAKPTYATYTGDYQLAFAPDIGLNPTPISFAEFISWAPEAKFEWINGRPHIGGGYDTNLHLTGLLLMTVGLKEAVRMLPAEAWNSLL